MSSGDPHAPDMKKIKREDKDGHVIIKKNTFLFIYFKGKDRLHTRTLYGQWPSRLQFFFSHPFFFSPNLLQMSDGERSDQDLVVDDGGDVRDI